MGRGAEKGQGCNTEPPTLGKKQALWFSSSSLILSPHFLTGGLPSLTAPSLPSLSLPTQALSPLKEPPLHNFPSTLSTSHTLRKATL